MKIDQKIILATLVLGGGVALFSLSSFADKAAMKPGAMTQTTMSNADKDYSAAMDKMMMGMMAAMTGKADLDFVHGMIPHHQGAIEMAQAELKYGKDPDIKKLAEGLVAAQEGEIKLMNAWLSKTNPSALPVDTASAKANESAMTTMMMNMAKRLTGNADVDFVKGMIPHHQGAIDMAKVELKYGKDPELTKLATDIVTAQEGEITFMNAWLAKNTK